MGDPREFVCRTCRKRYHLGHLSDKWIEADSLEEYDRVAVGHAGANYFPNHNLRCCLSRHRDHDFVIVDPSLCDHSKSDDILYHCPGPDVGNMIVEGYSLYEKIDLMGEWWKEDWVETHRTECTDLINSWMNGQVNDEA